ncbi:MAG: c-type cytochrome [Candidatus Sulfotelmatobacter sp.]
MLPSSRKLLVLALATLGVAGGPVAGSQAVRQKLRQKDSGPVSARGKQIFGSTCADCHGLDGRGGERAPNIAEDPRVDRLSSAQVAHIIENGIPGGGMPAFHSLEVSDVKAVVIYLRTLQRAKQTVKLPGDPIRGEAIFFGKAGCSSCHMVAGKGGFIASDLSAYGSAHAVEQIRSAITTPAPAGDQQVRLVTATTRGGEKYIGRVRNEDNFSLQLQMLDGRFLFLAKSDLEGLEYKAQTLMRSDYSSTLSPVELNDVVSYLMRAANTSEPRTPAKVDGWEEEE